MTPPPPPSHPLRPSLSPQSTVTTLPPILPSFRLLTLSATLSFSTFSASIPLLPLLLPSSPLFHTSLLLTAFYLPSLLIHPLLLSSHITPSLSLALCIAALFQAAGPLLLAAILLLVNVISPGDAAAENGFITLTYNYYVIALAVAFFLSGIGSALMHSGLLRYVGEWVSELPVEMRRKIVGVHVAALEACIAIGTIVSPVIFSLIIGKREWVCVPFLLSGVFILFVACWIICVLPEEEEEIGKGRGVTREMMRGERQRLHVRTGTRYGSSSGGRQKEVVTDMGGGREIDRGVMYALKYPWVWVVLVMNFMLSSSVSFFRPVLTEMVTEEMGMGRSVAGLLFGMMGLVGAFGESVGTAIGTGGIAVRNAGMFGMLVCVVGFKMLDSGSVGVWVLTLGVAIIVGGSSVSLVSTVTDLALTTKTEVGGVAHSLSLMTAFCFTGGEIAGVVVAGGLRDWLGSFGEAVRVYYRFLLGSFVLVLVPYLVGVLLMCFSPWWFLVARSRERTQYLPV